MSIKSILQTAALSMFCIGSLSMYGQEVLPQNVNKSFATPSGAEQVVTYLHHVPHENYFGPEAMWDIQFDHAVGTTAGSDGQAGAYYLNNEFYTSRWASDTIYKYDNAGALVLKTTISGLSGTRSITSDGTNLYIGNASNTIYEVDPVSLFVTNTITSAASNSARFVTYDSTANAGAGGFWTANFNTDITLVSRTGAVLNTITAATHTLGGMYGASVDNFSGGGPYLWVFHQSNGPSQASISQLKLPSGLPTGVVHDVDADFGAAGGLAGGLFISNQIVAGKTTLGGLLQVAGNRLFGYELDWNPILIDAELQSLATPDGLTMIPERWMPALNFNGSVRNLGQNTLTNLDVILDISTGGSSVYNGNNMFTNVVNLAVNNVAIGPYMPTAQGIYDVTGYASTGSQLDQDPGNDTIKLSIAITDTIVARDDGIHNGSAGYVVSSADPGAAMTVFNFPVASDLKGVIIELETPQHGQTTYPMLVDATSGAPLGAPIEFGNVVTIDSNINVYYLQFSSVQNIVGDWAVGCYSDILGPFLRQSNNIFTPGVNYFTTDLATWTWNASGIPTARFIRPVLMPEINSNVNQLADLGISNLEVFPNPTSNLFTVQLDLDKAQEVELSVFHVNGQRVMNMAEMVSSNLEKQLDLSSYADGSYLLEIRTAKGAIHEHIVKVK